MTTSPFFSEFSTKSQLVFKGNWDASKNSPTLTANFGTEGELYKCSVAGAASLGSTLGWNVGDILYFAGGKWSLLQAGNTLSLGVDTTHNGVIIIPQVSGQRATIQGAGVDATRGLQIYAAGAGGLFLGNATNGAGLQVPDLGAPVINSVSVRGAVSGGTPAVVAAGTDTDIGLNFIAVGAGVLQFQGRTTAAVSVTGSPSPAPVGPEAQVFTWNISADRYANPVGVHTTGWSMNHNYGGAGSSGGRVGLELFLNQTAAQGDAGTDNYYVGAAIYSNGVFNNGGTDTTFQGAKGRQFGFNPVANLNAGATNYYQVAGMEINYTISAGASAAVRSGLTLASLGGVGALQGAQVDAAIWLYGTGNAPMKSGWLIGSPAGVWPMDPNGSIIETTASDVARPTAVVTGWFGNLWQTTFSGGVLRSQGYLLDGAGNQRVNSLIVGNTSLTATATGLSIAAVNQLATVTAIATAGTGYYVGNLISTALGGLYKVASVSTGGVPTALTTLQQNVSASPPANPVATTVLGPVNSSTGIVPGTGLTLNLTWATAGLIDIPGVSSKALAASTSYATDALAAVGGVAVGQFYRNGSIVQVRVT